MYYDRCAAAAAGACSHASSHAAAGRERCWKMLGRVASVGQSACLLAQPTRCRVVPRLKTGLRAHCAYDE